MSVLFYLGFLVPLLKFIFGEIIFDASVMMDTEGTPDFYDMGTIDNARR